MKDLTKAINTFNSNEVKEEKKKAKKHYNKKTKQYKIVGVRFTTEEYEQVYKQAKKYESMSDYIKSLIFKDINK